jgi:hypothetical protein
MASSCGITIFGNRKDGPGQKKGYNFEEKVREESGDKSRSARIVGRFKSISWVVEG